MMALYGMGMMAASLFLLLSREAWHIANLAQEPVFLSPVFISLSRASTSTSLPRHRIIPLTLGLDAMRQLVFSGGPSLGFLSVSLEMTILVVLCVVFLIGAGILLAYMERLAIREGRLTEARR